MKKLFLLMTGVALSAFTMNAQQITNKSFVFDGKAHTMKEPLAPAKKLVMPKKDRAASTANKATASPRWYSYFDDIDTLTGGILQNNLSVIPMWFDSTVKQSFTSGDGTINFSSTALFIDPIRFKIFNDIGLHFGEMQVMATDAYTVDSVRIFGVYEEHTDRPATIVDTLIISLAPSGARYGISRTNPNVDVTPYLGSTQDTLYAYTAGNVDSVNRAVFSDVASANRVMWKEPLTAAMRDSGLNIKAMTFKVPGGLNVPAGNSFSIAVTFKSGDTWNPNVDNVSEFHNFLPLTGNMGDGTRMNYYYYTYDDRNTTNLMFSTDTSRYLPSILIEAINTPAFRYEYLNYDAYIICPTCPTISINSVNEIKAATVGDVYPNPAFDKVTVPFTMTEAANVNAVITNAIGAKVATQNLGKYTINQRGMASFDVTDFPNGIYFYTVEANGQRVTKRFVVAH